MSTSILLTIIYFGDSSKLITIHNKVPSIFIIFITIFLIFISLLLD
jgi:hypothetical protein